MHTNMTIIPRTMVGYSFLRYLQSLLYSFDKIKLHSLTFKLQHRCVSDIWIWQIYCGSSIAQERL